MSKENAKPTIACAPNGPYIVSGLAALQGPDGSTIPVDAKTALCRCGSSANKPICDGTHAKLSFEDEKMAQRTADKRDTYVGQSITIHDNRGLCAHAGICTNRLPAVWRMKQKPWIDPDGAGIAATVETINQCPSGALSYSISGDQPDVTDESIVIQVTKDGPYAVTGVKLTGQSWGDGASTEKYTLCRCGASKNKPFCDGTHWAVDFRDGAVDA